VRYSNTHPASQFNPNYVQAAKTWRAVAYSNLANDWAWGDSSPVHFICHSQGGTTVRYLIELLSGRYAKSYQKLPDTNCQSWVKSVVTIGTPHKGTTVTNVIMVSSEANKLASSKLNMEKQNLLPTDYMEILTRAILSVSYQPLGSRFYDLQLDHWGFFRLPNESPSDMYDRLRRIVPIWWQSEVNGFYDNSIAGVAKLDEFARIPSSKTYYFTMSFSATRSFPDEKVTQDDVNSFLALFPFSQITNPGGLLGVFSAHVFNFFSGIPGFPRFQTMATWFTKVANKHLANMSYFSRIPLPGSQIPRSDMLPLITLPAYAMGGYNVAVDDLHILQNIRPGDFHLNDGIVNTISMIGPVDGPIEELPFPISILASPATAASAKGKYWHLGRNITMDHADQIGVFTDWQTVSYSPVVVLLAHPKRRQVCIRMYTNTM
jgi:hypothetical protein